MRFMIADTFTTSLDALDGQSQALVKQAAFDFQLRPAHPSLQFHKLDRGKDKNFASFRVNKDLRVIVHRTAESLLLCYADHHDKAYAWAENRRLEVHPETGAAQIVEVRERVEEVVKRIVTTVEEKPAVFARFEAEYLAALGVPAEWLDALRTTDEEHLDALLKHLPEEATERLLALYLGEHVPRPTVAAPVDPFSHPDAQRRFRVVDGQDELRRALDAPWERWLVFLHPTQRAVVERKFNGPARVTGSAGTGKTVAALHRAAQLLRADPKARVVLTTHTRALIARLGHQADLLVGEKTPERARLSVDNLHRLAQRILRERFSTEPKIAEATDLLGWFETASTVAGDPVATPAFIRSEWEAIVDPHAIADFKAYRATPRAGRGTPLGAKQRQAVWRGMEHVLHSMEQGGATTWNRLFAMAAARLEASKERMFDHVIADEFQDIPPAGMRFLRALAAPGTNDLFLCGDGGQRIYRATSSWLAAGIDVRGRSSRLKVNYRTTEQIRRFADGLLPASAEESDGETESRQTVSILQGQPPECLTSKTVKDEIEAVAAWLEARIKEGHAPREIAVFARTKALLEARVLPTIAKAGLTARMVREEDTGERDEVTVGTMHSAKGLEFKVVALVGCDADVLPLKSVLAGLTDAGDRAAFLAQERSLFYVACTRARERLLVSAANEMTAVGLRGGS